MGNVLYYSFCRLLELSAYVNTKQTANKIKKIEKKKKNAKKKSREKNSETRNDDTRDKKYCFYTCLHWRRNKK